MKITEKQLRKIIREERQKLVSEAPRGRVHLEDLEPGGLYQVSIGRQYVGDSLFSAEFVGWALGDGGPLMKWRDEDDGTEREAYLYKGVFSAGSSAEPISVLRAVPRGAGDIV